jgi:uncharacterized membrane protein YciS (DUF1049 family)
LITFFDLISFFGVASLFAWLAFAPLQREQLDSFLLPKNLELARRNFATLNDYFFVSFVFFSIAAVFDYLYHDTTFPIYHQSSLLAIVGMCFFAGFVTLLTPMFYLRSMLTGNITWANVDPPGWGYAVAVAALTGFFAYISFQQSFSFNTLLGLIWFVVGFLVLYGGWRLIRYWKYARWPILLVILPVVIGVEMLIDHFLFPPK